RALPRPRPAPVGPPCARAQPPLLAPVGADPEEARVMTKRLLLLVTLCYLASTGAAFAHPLGNFTINRFARVEVAGDRLYVRYVLDLAEIPTFQAQQQGLDPRVYAPRLARGAELRVNSRPQRPVAIAHAVALPAGARGLN